MILSPERQGLITENSFALIVLADYVRLKHENLRLSCAVTDVPTVIEPKLAAQATTLTKRHECIRVAVEITADRVSPCSSCRGLTMMTRSKKLLRCSGRVVPNTGRSRAGVSTQPAVRPSRTQES